MQIKCSFNSISDQAVSALSNRRCCLNLFLSGIKIWASRSNNALVKWKIAPSLSNGVEERSTLLQYCLGKLYLKPFTFWRNFEKEAFMKLKCQNIGLKEDKLDWLWKVKYFVHLSTSVCGWEFGLLILTGIDSCWWERSGSAFNKNSSITSLQDQK